MLKSKAQTGKVKKDPSISIASRWDDTEIHVNKKVDKDKSQKKTR